MKTLFICLVGVLQLSLASAHACTAVEIGAGENVATGQNLGWFWTIDAGLVVNKRGMAKSGMRASESDKAAAWTSKYGSITINPIGREFPLGGLNEKGLSVQGLHSYDGRFETTSNLPVLNQFQWVQYQLDLSATVEEAIANAQAVRPTDNPQLTLHYLVCDGTGKCATFEWLNGTLHVRSGKELALNAYTNTNYAGSVQAYEACPDETCPLPQDGPNYSLQRFVQAARLVKSYDGSSDPSTYLFHLLDVVKQPQPLASWSIVTRNARALTLSLSAPGSAAIQFVDLRAYDFSCATPAQMQLVDVSQTGDVRGLFKDYDISQQKRLVAGTRVPEQAQKRLWEYPDQTVCVTP